MRSTFIHNSDFRFTGWFYFYFAKRESGTFHCSDQNTQSHLFLKWHCSFLLWEKMCKIQKDILLTNILKVLCLVNSTFASNTLNYAFISKSLFVKHYSLGRVWLVICLWKAFFGIFLWNVETCYSYFEHRCFKVTGWVQCWG